MGLMRHLDLTLVSDLFAMRAVEASRGETTWSGRCRKCTGWSPRRCWRGWLATVGKPEENGYAERLMRTIGEEEISLTVYADFADAHGQLARFLDVVYNRKRIHSALGYLTPAEFEQWRAEQAAAPTIQ